MISSVHRVFILQKIDELHAWQIVPAFGKDCARNVTGVTTVLCGPQNDLAVLFRDSFNWRKLVQAYWVVFGVKSECWNSDLLDIFFDADIVVQILLVFVAVHLDIDMLFNMAQTRFVLIESMSEVFVVLLRHYFFDVRQLIFLYVVVQVDPNKIVVETVEVAAENGNTPRIVPYV